MNVVSATAILPDQWILKKLKYVARMAAGDAITSDEIREEGDYPVFGGNGLRGYTDRFNREGDFVLIGRQGALCGNINYAAGQFWASEHAIVADVQGNAEVHWLGELLTFMNLNQYSQSAAQPGIAVDVIANLPIPVPPRSIQRAISRFLAAETSEIDALIAAKHRLLDLMAEKRRAIVAEAVMRGLNPTAPLRPSGVHWLGDIPVHWEALDLKWVVARVTSGVSVNASNQPAEGDELGVLKTSAVLGGSFFPLENKSVWLHEYERVTCPVTAGSIIVSRMNTPLLVGESGYVETDYPNLFLPDRLWKIETSVQRALPRFIAQVLSSPMVRSAISEMATGTSASMKNLSQDDLLGLPIPLPPLDEQHQIVEHISTETAKIDRLRTATENSVALLKERRAALIAAAVTGQIEIPEAA